MKPPLNPSKKTQTIRASSLKNLRKKTSWILVTETDKQKASCEYSKTKKIN